MRIAVSGTHGSGKSTLIEAFLDAHTDYAHEPEPYTVLVEEYGEEFSAEPTAEDFLRQLEFNLERLAQYRPGDRVIFERCPLDFLAYLQALGELRRDAGATAAIETALETVPDGLAYLDLIVFLPLDDADPIALPEEEDLELRDAVDRSLTALFSGEPAGLDPPRVLELTGSLTKRFGRMERALES